MGKCALCGNSKLLESYWKFTTEPYTEVCNSCIDKIGLLKNHMKNDANATADKAFEFMSSIYKSRYLTADDNEQFALEELNKILYAYENNTTIEQLQKNIQQQENEIKNAINSVFINTAETFGNYTIAEYKDFVGSQIHFFAPNMALNKEASDLFMKNRQNAIFDIKSIAFDMGANAIINVKIDTYSEGSNFGIFAYGTAVIVKPNQ